MLQLFLSMQRGCTLQLQQVIIHDVNLTMTDTLSNDIWGRPPGQYHVMHLPVAFVVTNKSRFFSNGCNYEQK